MTADIINEFRNVNNKERILCWNPAENDYCLQHCLHMSRLDRVEHAPEYLLKDKAEVIAMCKFVSDTNTTIKYLIFNVINESEEHRNVILNYENLAYGVYVHDYKVYLTIRGWR